MDCWFELRARMLVYAPDGVIGSHVEVDAPTVEMRLTTSNNIDVDAYADKKTGGLNEAGYRVSTEILIQGMIANIHSAHDKGLIDSADHLRHIIGELEKRFINAEYKVEEGFKS